MRMNREVIMNNESTSMSEAFQQIVDTHETVTVVYKKATISIQLDGEIRKSGTGYLVVPRETTDLVVRFPYSDVSAVVYPVHGLKRVHVFGGVALRDWSEK